MSRISNLSTQRDENYASATTDTSAYSRPFQTFPRTSTTSISLASITSSSLTLPLPSEERDYLDEELSLILINSDSQECNENFSIFIKCIVDNIYNNSETKPTYERLSLYALKLLTSNLFVKNFKFCIGKILAFLETFTTITNYRLEFNGNSDEENDNEWEVNDQVAFESECLKEFLCITLLLLLKLKNTSNDQEVNDDSSDLSSTSSATSNSLDLVNGDYVFKTLEQSRFILIMSQFISTQIKAVAKNESSFVILKFGCDIIFEYFYYVEILSPTEFMDLTFNNNEVIVTIIKHLLSSEGFNNYDLENDDDFHNEAKLVAYEELKLLLLINEQFLMSSYSRNEHSNKVFEELIHNDDANSKSNVNNIVGFINLLIYHLNREESQIIILLILKFLYLVFTTSFTAKLIYRNDLKILLDIFLRELDNLQHKDNILIVTYLRVLYPILMFSELNECNGYKSKELYNVMSNIIVNSEQKETDKEEGNSAIVDAKTISNLAMKCMNVKWLKNLHHQTKATSSETPPSPPKKESPELASPDDLKSIDRESSRLFTRIASVRSSSRSDYHKHTTQHNFLERKNSEKKSKTRIENEDSSAATSPAADAGSPSLFMDNNHNVFLTDFNKKLTIGTNRSQTLTGLNLNDLSAVSSTKNGEKNANDENGNGHTYGCDYRDANILDLPNEYLMSKPIPKLPIPEKRQRQLYVNGAASTSSSSLESNSSIKQKALKKKAPPPPPPPPRRRR
ncbi:LDB17 [Candida metapsilosis]|uniref:LDB17 n=1 Tax=Candida metapsilosis TaxID=273372 RepID=A0A8H7ZJ94_9ASCO|nr:LDB17 [Candida metapsilosis]